MLTLQQNIVIPENHQVHLDLQVPESVSSGETEVLLIFQPVKKLVLEKRIFGQLKGKINIPQNFDNEIDTINEMFYGEYK